MIMQTLKAHFLIEEMQDIREFIKEEDWPPGITI